MVKVTVSKTVDGSSILSVLECMIPTKKSHNIWFHKKQYSLIFWDTQEHIVVEQCACFLVVVCKIKQQDNLVQKHHFSEIKDALHLCLLKQTLGKICAWIAQLVERLIEAQSVVRSIRTLSNIIKQINCSKKLISIFTKCLYILTKI